MFNFQRERLNIEDALGRGAFAEIYPYQENERDLNWVVKYMEVNRSDELLRCFSEILMSSSFEHPCVLPTKGYFIEKARDGRDGYNVYMKLPRMRMDLFAEFRMKERTQNFYTETQLVKYFYCLASGMQYLHNKRIFYIDIKLSNILLDNEGNVKLCDFGVGKFIPEDEQDNLLTRCDGTQNYKAPELIHHEQLIQRERFERERDPNVQNELLNNNSLSLFDSWGLGLVMLELCFLKIRPVHPFETAQTIQRTLSQIREKIEERNLYGAPLLDLIFGLLSIDPRNRLRVPDVRSMLAEAFPQILTEEYRARFGAMDEEARIERLSREYEIRIEGLRQENIEILKRYAVEANELKQEIKRLEDLKPTRISFANPRSYKERKEYRGKLRKGKSKLQEKWKDIVEIEGGQDDVFLKIEKDNITDQELENLAKDLIKICNETEITKDLKMLEVDLESCYKITDMGMKSLSEQISVNLKKSLQHLHLNLVDCEKITDKGLLSLNGYVAVNLQDLQYLELNFDGCKITDAAVEDLGGQILSNLKNLQHLYLSFTGCKGITDVGVKYLEEAISGNLENLQHIYLNFDRCSVTHEIREWIRAKLSNTIPLVEIK